MPPCRLGAVSPCLGCLAEPRRGQEADFGEACASGSVWSWLAFDSCWVGVQAGVGVGRPPRPPTGGGGTWHARSPQLPGCDPCPRCRPLALGCGRGSGPGAGSRLGSGSSGPGVPLPGVGTVGPVLPFTRLFPPVTRLVPSLWVLRDVPKVLSRPEVQTCLLRVPGRPRRGRSSWASRMPCLGHGTALRGPSSPRHVAFTPSRSPCPPSGLGLTRPRPRLFSEVRGSSGSGMPPGPGLGAGLVSLGAGAQRSCPCQRSWLPPSQSRGGGQGCG